ncbi:exocyst complex component SEC8-like, partial [Trifolium medium]|nr:exocyst complex component SEC8-like [Trifolium medium]
MLVTGLEYDLRSRLEELIGAHIIASTLMQVPARIEKLISEKQLYAAVQLHVQSMLFLKRGLQTILEDLHAHLYNKGEYSAAGSTMLENDDEVPTTTSVALTTHNSQPCLEEQGHSKLPKQKRKNGISIAGTLLAVSPVSPLMAPGGKAQVAAKELLDSILDAVVRIFENHVVVGDLLEAKASQHVDVNTPKLMPVDVNWNPDSETSQATGGYNLGFSLTVLQSECQQLICEILRATPEAASADA